MGEENLEQGGRDARRRVWGMDVCPSRGCFLSRVDFSSQAGLPLAPSPLFYLRLQSATPHFPTYLPKYVADLT